MSGRVTDYCGLALDYLSLAFDPQQALFSYSSRLDPQGRIANDFLRPESLRYTINTYLGLAEAQRHGAAPDWLGPVEERVGQFLSLHEDELTSPADLGLLLVLLAGTDPAHPAVHRALRAIAEALTGPGRLTLNLQDLAWMLWGAATHPDDEAARQVATSAFERIRRSYVAPESGLARHSLARYRSHIVSFGSLVYFLRAVHEYAGATRSAPARALFETALPRVLALQGKDGAWPWLIDVRSGLPFDRYPIFTVHQDSMAMLFLFLAADAGANPSAGAAGGLNQAIERSLRWNLGANELGAQMVLTEPYPWIYRSIERVERASRVRRYLRGLGRPPTDDPPRARRLRINGECRSYHLGWVLYVWSNPARRSQLEGILG